MGILNRRSQRHYYSPPAGQTSFIKGTVLENYSFDIRDFSDAQLGIIYDACLWRVGNLELKSRMESGIRDQRRLKDKYLKRVAQARSDAYKKYLRHKNFSRIGVPESVILKYDAFLESIKDYLKALVPSNFSIYTKDSMQWPEIQVQEEDVKSAHIIAGMPPESIDLSGSDRLKQAFLPEFYMKYYNADDPTHTYNQDVLLQGTFWSALLGGGYQALQHAKNDLNKYKKDATHIYESRREALRARQDIWTLSFIRYMVRWGWRVGFLFASTCLISQSLSIYRLQDKLTHYVTAAAISTSLYKWKLGLSGMLKTGLIGATLIGLPTGFVLATLGYNPKMMHYFCSVEPRAIGPLTGYSMSPEQYFLAHSRMLAILNILNTKHCEELNSDRFYREFVGVDE